MLRPAEPALRVALIRVPAAQVPRSAESVCLQREAARAALRACARWCGAPVDGWKQSPDGVPLPQGAWHWSVSHTRMWAGAVVADQPVGVDIEAISPRREELFDEIASKEEWECAGGRTWPIFFRIWTAKEAVLKANSVGIGRLDGCRIVRFDPEGRMVLEYGNTPWRVEHHEFDGHIACVTCGVGPVEWRICGSIDQQRPVANSVIC